MTTTTSNIIAARPVDPTAATIYIGNTIGASTTLTRGRYADDAPEVRAMSRTSRNRRFPSITRTANRLARYSRRVTTPLNRGGYRYDSVDLRYRLGVVEDGLTEDPDCFAVCGFPGGTR